WNELRGFYSVCNRQEATLPALQKTHRELTRAAMAQQPLVLILHDGSQMDFTGHKALQGTGPIGEGHARGFLQHNSLAVVPQPRGPEVPLMSHARSLPSQGQAVVDIPSRGGRPARTAVVQMAAAAVWVPAPTEVRKRWQQPILAAWVIRVWEANPPADVQEP